MIAEINKIYQKIGLIELEKLKIGSDRSTSDFDFYKLTQLEKLISSSNVNWNLLNKTKKEIINQINSLNII